MRKIKLIIFIFVAILNSNYIFGNDSPFSISWNGNIVPLNEKNNLIRMETELVEIYLYGEYYQVIASYDFYNYGDSITMLMGFPELRVMEYHDSLQYKPVTGFNYSTSFVDGIEVELQSFDDEVYEDQSVSLGYNIYCYKFVKFEKNQRRKIKFIYLRDYSNKKDVEEIEYNFTGGNWYRDMEHCKLIVYPQVEFQHKEPLPEGTIYKDGKYIFEKRNWEPEHKFMLKGFIENNTIKVLFFDKYLFEFYEMIPKEKVFLNNYYYYVVKDYFRNIKLVSPLLMSKYTKVIADRSYYLMDNIKLIRFSNKDSQPNTASIHL